MSHKHLTLKERYLINSCKGIKIQKEIAKNRSIGSKRRGQ